MKNNVLIKLSAIICLTICLGCQKEESIDIIDNLEQFNAPSIEAAQSFYNNKTNSSTYRVTTSSVTDWENSKSKKYKKTEEVDVDILYTPIYLDTQFNAKAFIASTEYEGVVDARKLYVLYKNEDISNGISAYIVVFKLDGTFDKAYNYENGIEIPFPTSSDNTASRTSYVDCNDTNVSTMTDEEYEEFLATCYSPLPEVTVTTTIDAGDSGGGASFNPFDNSNGWAGIISFSPVGDDNSGGGTSTTTGNNPQVFVPNTVTATALSITLALEVDFNSEVEQWLQEQELADNYALLDAIAAFLNANKVRPLNPALDNFGENQFPTINTDAINSIINLIEIFIDNQNMVDNYNQLDYSLEDLITLLENYYVAGPDTPINNIGDYLSIFDTNIGAKITLYVDQPIAGTNELINETQLDVGHAFISIQQGNKIRSFGFYPMEGAGFPNPVLGIMGNNSNTSFDVSLSQNVNALTLNNIIDISVAVALGEYDLLAYNCSDFVVDVADLMEINFTNTETYIGIGNITNPGTLGESIRDLILQQNLPDGNTTGGISPLNSN